VVFWKYCQRMAVGMSQPSIMFQAKLRDGSTIIVDDYREAYWWLRDTTAKDSRVMAWWDYGYQINGIAERTSIADGNTWNHEHIATLGKQTKHQFIFLGSNLFFFLIFLGSNFFRINFFFLQGT
jgi:hypothetical protein